MVLGYWRREGRPGAKDSRPRPFPLPPPLHCSFRTKNARPGGVTTLFIRFPVVRPRM